MDWNQNPLQKNIDIKNSKIFLDLSSKAKKQNQK